MRFFPRKVIEVGPFRARFSKWKLGLCAGLKGGVLALVSLSCILLAGCAQTTQNRQGVGDGSDQKGYLHADSSSVIFLHWTEINGKLNGQMNVFFAKGNRSKNTDTSGHSFEGVSDGKNISLNFTGSLWTDGLGGKTWTGTMAGNELTLVIPSNTGELSPVKFGVGTVEQYNDAVLKIKQGVRDENARVQQQDAQAAQIQSERAAVVEGSNRVKSSLETLKSATAQFDNGLNFDSLFESYERTWQKMQGDHQKLIAKASEKPFDSFKLGSVESLLGAMQSDIGAFESHAGALNSNIERITNGIKSIRQAEAELRSSLQQFQGAVRASSSGGAGSDVDEGDLQTVIKAGDQKIREAVTAAKQAGERGAKYRNEANALYRKDEATVKSLRAVAQ